MAYSFGASLQPDTIGKMTIASHLRVALRDRAGQDVALAV
jgi:hypothetical protein